MPWLISDEILMKIGKLHIETVKNVVFTHLFMSPEIPQPLEGLGTNCANEFSLISVRDLVIFQQGLDGKCLVAFVAGEVFDLLGRVLKADVMVQGLLVEVDVAALGAGQSQARVIPLQVDPDVDV